MFLTNRYLLIKRPEIGSTCHRESVFFKRSSSTICLGGTAPDPFHYSLEESLPLATRPHLLQPHVRIQDMFRVKSNDVDQFVSLNRIGLMSSGLRRQVPYLAGPRLATTSSKSKRNTSFKRIKTTKLNYTNKFYVQLERRLIRLAQQSTYHKSSAAQLSRPSQLIDRWRLTVDLFGRVFCDDVGLEPGSVIRQLGGFQLKEAKFRREMERLRNTANRELLMEVDRDRDLLLQATFKSLNNMYNLQNTRRAASSASISNSTGSSSLLPPVLCLNRIKVTFRDEQGEGSGVARSFYTAFCEAVLADVPLPNLDAFYNQVTSTSTSSLSASVSYVPFNMLQRYRNTRGLESSRRTTSMPNTPISTSIPNLSGTTSSLNPRSTIRPRDSSVTSAMESLTSSNSQQTLSINAPAFYSPLIAITSTSLSDLPSFDLSFYNSLDAQHRESGQQLYTKINQVLTTTGVSPSHTVSNSYKAARITGMILELRSSQIQQLLASEQLLKAKIDEGLALLTTPKSPVISNLTTNQQQSQQTTSTFTSAINVQLSSAAAKPSPDNAPLFWQPDKTMSGAGFYSPRRGNNTAARLNAFRNVGRIMAICLLQNELCPITLSRHCIKFVLGRPIRWHDLAFFDSQMYESFRKMIKDAESLLVNEVMQARETGSSCTVRSALINTISRVNKELFQPLDLTFNIDLPKEEGGTNNDLVENGSKIEVNCVNVYEFVKRYAEFRMVKHVESALQELKNGVYDVLPANAFEGLTAEDFRLLLNGVADINIHTLASYTTISDESKVNF